VCGRLLCKSRSENHSDSTASEPHVALLIAAGTHPKVIQARLGHASIRTVLDTYGHLFDGFDQSAADALDEAMANRSVGCQVSVPARQVGSGTSTTLPRGFSQRR